MAKSSGLAVFALIIAIGALGLGVYQIFFVSAPTGSTGGDSGIRNIWSDHHYTSVKTNPTDTWIHVDQLLINFTVSTGESAFFLFSTRGIVQAGVPSYMQLNFALDSVRLSGPAHPWYTLQTQGALIITPISFHYVFETISAGAHNLSIHIYGNDISNEIFSSTLLIQTYIS